MCVARTYKGFLDAYSIHRPRHYSTAIKLYSRIEEEGIFDTTTKLCGMAYRERIQSISNRFLVCQNRYKLRLKSSASQLDEHFYKSFSSVS